MKIKKLKNRLQAFLVTAVIFCLIVYVFIALRNYSFDHSKSIYTGAPSEFVAFEKKREELCPIWENWEKLEGNNFEVVSVNCPLNQDLSSFEREKVLVKIKNESIGVREFKSVLKDYEISELMSDIEYEFK